MTQCAKPTDSNNKTTIDLSGVVFQDKQVSFTGNAQTLVADQIPDKVKVDYVIKNSSGAIVTSASEIGTYTIVATFSLYNTNAFAWADGSSSPVVKNATLNIVSSSPKTIVDVSKVTFTDLAVIADGKSDYNYKLAAVGIPTGVTVTYSGNGANGVNGTSNVNDYPVTATFSLSNPNLYEWQGGTAPAPISAKISVLKQLVWATDVIPALINSCTNQSSNLIDNTGGSCHGWSISKSAPNKTHFPIYASVDSMTTTMVGSPDTLFLKYSINEVSAILNRMLPKFSTVSMINSIKESPYGRAQSQVPTTTNPNNRIIGVPYDSSGVAKIYYYSKWYYNTASTKPNLSLTNGSMGGMRGTGDCFYYSIAGGTKVSDTCLNPVFSNVYRTGSIKNVDAALIQWIMGGCKK